MLFKANQQNVISHQICCHNISESILKKSEINSVINKSGMLTMLGTAAILDT